MILLAFLIIWLLLTIVILIVIVSSLIGFLFTRVPFVTTTKKDIEIIVKRLPVTSKDYFFDLGSGDGKVIFIVEQISGAKVKGFELTWWTHIWARIKKVLQHSRAELVNKNFFKQGWSQATIIYGYLYPPLMSRVEQKFIQECKPGTVAVLRDFSFPNLKPQEVWHFGPTQHPEKFIDTKLNRFKALLKSFWPSTRNHNHEMYIYKHP